MSTFTFNIYLVQDIDDDGQADYVLQDEGRILISTKSITVDTAYRYIGGQAAKRGRPPQTFNIQKRADDTWYFLYNKRTWVGMFPNREAALGALYGVYTANDGYDDGFAAWLADSLEKGSVLDSAENALALTHTVDDISVMLSDYNTGSTSSYPFVYFGWEKLVDGVPQGITISEISQLSAASEDADQSATFTSAWAGLGDGEGARPVLVGFDSGTFTIIAFGLGQSKPPAAPVLDFDVEISGVDGVPGEDVVLGSFAYALIDDNSIDAPPNQPTFTYEWFQSVPTLTGITLTNEGS